MTRPKDHLNEMLKNIHWIGFNGHLKTQEAAEAINEIEQAIFKAQKVFEELVKENHNAG